MARKVITISAITDSGRRVGPRNAATLESNQPLIYNHDDKDGVLMGVWSLLHNTAGLRSVIITPGELPDA